MKNNPAGNIELENVDSEEVFPKTTSQDKFTPVAQETSQQNPVQAILDSFEKIKKSHDNIEEVKSQTKTPELNKPVKLEGISQTAWKKELGRIETERSKQVEFAQMNATALAATKQVKRATSSLLIGNVGAKKTLAHTENGLD